jgi:NTP pyrophosphatase (non-canonical NTP hydrolase)
MIERVRQWRARMNQALTLEILLRKQRDLQHLIQGEDCATLTDGKRAEYIRLNVLAATDELHELLAEVGWKTWKKQGYGLLNRDRYLDELADVMIFCLNLAVAADADGLELTDRIMKKQRVNEQRSAAGY